MSDFDEPDQLQGSTHPRETLELLGQNAPLRELSDALSSNRFPHAWIFSGPEGVGKATAAYRLARFILKNPPGSDMGAIAGHETLDVSPDDTVFHQVAAQSHPGLKVITRPYDPKTKRVKTEITVNEIRSLHKLFNTTTTDGGWRIAIIDCADEMNRNAANALLKTLEEPPQNACIILISHQAGRLLPTIKSRCRILQFKALPQNDVTQIIEQQLSADSGLSPEDKITVARLANGSARRALQLAQGAGLRVHSDMISLLETLPNLNSLKAHELADSLARRDAQEEFRFFRQLLSEWLNSFVRMCTTGRADHLPQRERELFERLGTGVDLEPWLEVWEKTLQSFIQADALNLDKRQLVLTLFFQLETAAKQALRLT